MLIDLEELLEMQSGEYLVKNVLPTKGLVCVYGAPGTGKSFWVLHLASRISDNEEWFGHRVVHCNVVYLCLEGQEGLAKRAQAYRKYHGPTPYYGMLSILTDPFSLLNPAHVNSLINEIKNLSHPDNPKCGQYVIRAIFIDTLNAASPGGDENSSADMGKIIEAVKRIIAKLLCTVILIHHSGKDSTRGLRGHSSLLAASDVVIEVTREGDRRKARVVKSKDGVEGEEYPFRLHPVELDDVDSDGDPIISCAVVPEERVVTEVKRLKLPSGGNQKTIFRVANELLQQTTNFGESAAPSESPCVRVEDLIKACHGRLTSDSRRVAERVKEAVISLVNNGFLVLRDGWLWVP